MAEAGFTALLRIVIPAKAGIQRLQSHASVKPWMPAFAGMTIGGFRREWVYRERNPQPLVPRQSGFPAPLQAVIPAKAGIQRLQSHAAMKPWMPAFAGMTIGGFRREWVYRERNPQPLVPRQSGFPAQLPAVIPAKAGIQRLQSHAAMKPWMLAFAGMTIGGFRREWVYRERSPQPLGSAAIGFPRAAPSRHPREGGDPETSESCCDEALDARVRGHDDRWVSA